ncbi:hypothetical protein HMPREF1051_1563 [Neisseria sicca VK64]|uniref:Uncharacterized protein n=1 Tax=Neisseria sicca VK64 TaxID=1095748 RepID=I2NJL1_NEISI|nr:hypothetical protein HMPREF1051_1563 [Neisseria sicca VK64]
MPNAWFECSEKGRLKVFRRPVAVAHLRGNTTGKEKHDPHPPDRRH